MELPGTAYAIGWYSFGARPADRSGTTVLAGHVDTRRRGPGPAGGPARRSTRGRDRADGGRRHVSPLPGRRGGGDPQGAGAPGADLRPRGGGEAGGDHLWRPVRPPDRLSRQRHRDGPAGGRGRLRVLTWRMHARADGERRDRAGPGRGGRQPAACRADREAERGPLALPRAGRPDHLRRRVRRRHAGAERAGGRLSRPAYAGLADPAGGRTALHHLRAGGAPAAADEPGQRVQPRGARALGGPGRPRAGGEAGGPVGLPLRAEGRRVGAGPGLRAGPAGPGGHPRRRPGRGGRHGQRADDQGDPAAADADRTCRACWRSAGRCSSRWRTSPP